MLAIMEEAMNIVLHLSFMRKKEFICIKDGDHCSEFLIYQVFITLCMLQTSCHEQNNGYVHYAQYSVRPKNNKFFSNAFKDTLIQSHVLA